MISLSRAARASAFLVALACPYAYALDFEGIAPAALAQPQINFLVRTTPAGDPLTALFRDPAGDPNYDITYHNIDAYFDTGASGISLSGATCDDLGIVKATSQNPTFLGQEIHFGDVGAAGPTLSYVSNNLYISLAAYTPAANTSFPTPDSYAAYTQTLPATRVSFGPLQSATADPIDEFLKGYNVVDVVGMPAMKGKVVVLDVRKVDNFDLDAAVTAILDGLPMPDYDVRTHVYTPGSPANPVFSANADNPGIPITNRHIKLSYGSFDRFTATTPDPTEGPTQTHNPFIGADPVAVFDGLTSPAADNSIKLTLGNQPAITGNFLFDTGAAASMISVAKAALLGITVTYTTEPDPLGGEDVLVPHIFRDNIELLGDDTFSLSLAGAGGESFTVAGFYLDSLLLHTIEGDPLNDNDPLHIRFLHAPILVHDISLEDPDNAGHFLTLDGIFGMNYLIASADFSGDIYSIGPTIASPFDWITFDEPNGILGLNIKDEFLPEVTPEPTTLSFLALGLLPLLRRRK